MENIRDLAIDKLGSIASAAERFALANEYDITDWLLPAYTELCMRMEPLNLEEGKKLGIEAVINIGAMKHEISENLRKFVDSAKVGQISEQQFGEKKEGRGSKRT